MQNADKKKKMYLFLLKSQTDLGIGSHNSTALAFEL